MGILIPCIIAGGAGSRLWPVSRQTSPKPFMRLNDGQSLLQKTLLRAVQLDDVQTLLTVINRDLLFRTLDDYRSVETQQVRFDFILEPMGRNTAPAIATAALHVARHYGSDAQLLVMPADHLINDQVAFMAAVKRARILAEQGLLVTFGIQPEHPETGFGYIERGSAIGTEGFEVAKFVEKPDIARAQAYMDGGRHFWNAGMFCFRADAVLNELAMHAPAVLGAVTACLDKSRRHESEQSVQVELDAEEFSKVEDISIDYALMERSKKAAVVPCTLGWSDIGSWQSLRDLSPRDDQGNQIKGDVILHNVHNCFIDSPKRVIGAVGVENLIVVDTPDALLIANAASTQDVKFIAEALKLRGHDAHRLHTTVNRPWGTYTVLEDGGRFKIKRILVKPGESLSLQMHHHRSEHWIVVSGTARVVNGEHELLLNTNESTYIPAGHTHRLSNPGVIDLQLIEVQSGEYLGEDDIVRFKDEYGRIPDVEVAG